MEIYRDYNGVTVDAPDDVPEVANNFYRILKPNGVPLCTLSFQTGAPSAVGVNGATNETVIAVVANRLKLLNDKIPCHENENALSHLYQALYLLDSRSARIVEGKLVP